MRTLLAPTLTALLLLGATGCGGDDDTATKTVTVAAPTPTASTPAPTASTAAPAAGDESAGPPLPDGVLGVDGRYLLKTVSTDFEKQNIGVERFGAYEEPSTATTRCAGERCSVTFRFGLKSGGTKAYTLRADPARHLTYVGTGRGQIECLDNDSTKVASRERIAVRAGSPTKIGGREVAGRLSLYATITARCPAIVETGKEAVRFVATLRGPRQP